MLEFLLWAWLSPSLSLSEEPAAAPRLTHPGWSVTATEFSYSPTRIEATTDATLRLRNDGAVYHDLRIEGVDDFSLEALPDEDATGSIELEAGSYVLFCSVPGHREAGMVAELQVS